MKCKQVKAFAKIFIWSLLAFLELYKTFIEEKYNSKRHG